MCARIIDLYHELFVLHGILTADDVGVVLTTDPATTRMLCRFLDFVLIGINTEGEHSNGLAQFLLLHNTDIVLWTHALKDYKIAILDKQHSTETERALLISPLLAIITKLTTLRKRYGDKFIIKSEILLATQQNGAL